MIILHVASLGDNRFSGVRVAVPQHIIAQSNIANVGLVNINNTVIDGIENWFPYCKDFKIENLSEPFSRPDIVVFHELYKKAYLSIASQLKRLNTPYVIVPHGSLTSEAQKKKRLKKILANAFLFNRFVNCANAIQYLSLKEMSNSRVSKAGFVGTNGVYVPVETKASFNSDSVLITYIGRLEVIIKGLDLLIKAVSLIHEDLKKENCKIKIYGPDILNRYAEVLSLITKYRVSDIVELKHEIEGEAKRQALLASDIFIQTSRTEGMPQGILEAMSYGVPCLVTKGTNLVEIVSQIDAGWGVENDSRAIADCILKAIRERNEWETKSKNAKCLITAHFAWDKVSKDIVENYAKIIENRSPCD